MKYEKPIMEIFVLVTNDVIAASNGSITADNITITGSKDEFSANFSDLF